MISLYTAFAGGRRRTVIALASVVLYAGAVCAGAVDMHGGWRSPIRMANAIGPNGLARGWHDVAAGPLAALTTLAVQAVIHAPIGALLAIALGRSRLAAVMAAALGFDLSATEQTLCWLRRGGTANLVAPIVAALAALATWRLVCQARRLRPVRQRDRGRFIAAIGLLHALAAIAACIGLLGYGLATSGMTPSQMATFLTLHATGRPIIMDVIQPIAARLESLDRMNLSADLAPPAWAGADVRRDVPRPPGRLRMVGSIAALRQTIEDAQPGDVIEMLPGHYQMDASIVISRAGTRDDPVVLRAASLGTVMIDATTVEAFKVYAPHWVFENLAMRGICPDDTHCDHAFHVVGGAVDTQFRNLRLEDFNAHFKINGEHGGFPDGGRIEYVTLIDTHPRRTAVPVAPIDLDGASFWLMSDNFIADFAKAGGDRASYGGYAKAAGSGNVFERNVVLCE